MKTFLKMLVIALCCVSCITPFSVFAEEGIAPAAIDGGDYILNGVQQAKFDEIIQEVSNNSDMAIWYNSNEQSLCWTYNFSYDAATSMATFTTRYQMRQDGSIQTQTNSTSNHIYENTVVHYYVFKYNGVVIFGNDYITDRPQGSWSDVSCPVAMNDVVANDYVASLMMYVYRAGIENFIIYRKQFTQDVTNLSSLYSNIRQVGEIKGYVLTTHDNVIVTHVIEYSRPTIYSYADGPEYFMYLNLLDPDYANNYEMVLHSKCLETIYSSEMEGLADVNNSLIQQTVQNATSISNQNTMISQNQQIIDTSNKTNDLIEKGNEQTNATLDSSSLTIQITEEVNNQILNFEDTHFNQLSSSVNDFNNFRLPTDFSLSASFVRTQFQDIWNFSPLGVIISFCLMIGVISLVFGRRD